MKLKDIYSKKYSSPNSSTSIADFPVRELHVVEIPVLKKKCSPNSSTTVDEIPVV